MRVCAEFEDHFSALAAHKHLVDEGLDPQEIEIRSPYPLPEHPIPPHRSTAMHMRTFARIMWAVAVTLGFSFVTYTQYEWAPVTVTNGHPLIAPPITMLVTYECGMFTAIWTTTFMFFLETFRFRSLVPPLEEDMPVAIGYVALVVGGRSADRAMSMLEGKGARSIVSYACMLAMLGMLTGCAQFNMRQQDVYKSTEVSADFAPSDSVRMPSKAEQAVAPPEAIGYNQTGNQTLFNENRALFAKAMRQISDPSTSGEAGKSMQEADKFKARALAMGTYPKMYEMKDRQQEMEKAVAGWVNPVKPTQKALERGKHLYEVNCGACHGLKGQGDGEVGKVCQPVPPAIGNTTVMAGRNDGYYYYNIYAGKNNMPPFGYKLSPEEISSIILHLHELQKGK